MPRDGDADRMLKLTYEAVSILVSSRGTLRERVCDAYISKISEFMLPISPWEDLQEAYTEIKERMDPWIDVSEHPEIQFNDELRYIADKMLDLYTAALKRYTQLRDIRVK